MCFSRGIVEYLLLLVVNVEDLTRLELKETRHARQPGSLPRFLGKAEVLSCDKDKDVEVPAPSVTASTVSAPTAPLTDNNPV